MSRRRKRTENIRWQKSWAVTMGMILLIAAASYLATCWINKKEEEKCFAELYDEAGELASDIESYAANDREELELLATVIAEYEELESQELWKMLDSYSVLGMMSRIEILLPDNTVLTKGGERIDTEGALSFEKESELGAHITGREKDVGEDGGYVVRNYVPIVKGGETIAMLYGVVELKNLPEEIRAKPYGGEAAIYIIEGETGDFLVDTWHEEPGNIWELGQRKMARGYDHEQLKQGLIDGDSGYVVFVSETIGKYLYFYYEPMEINDWRIALSVPEDVVFASAKGIRNVLNIFMIFESICFVLYFLWMFRHVRGEMEEKQRQMNTLNDIYDVQKILFNAHESRGNITIALAKIGEMTSGENVGFWIKEREDTFTPYTWSEESKGAADIFEGNMLVDALLEYFEKRGMQFEAKNLKSLKEKLPSCQSEHLKNLAAVPIEGTDGSICGVLAGGNMRDIHGKLALLKNVSFSFSMLQNNMNSYNIIKEQGEKDLLTGLYNRNRYELDLSLQQKTYEASLACIYIDVNGLHELNNEEGHEAGDRMLKNVAKQIGAVFGTRFSYRIGGDEFLIFVPDTDQAAVSDQVEELVENLKKIGIHISAGMQWEEKVSSLDVFVREAEKKMYRVKERFYQQQAQHRKGRDRLYERGTAAGEKNADFSG